MKKSGSILKNLASRRRFLQNGMISAGAATIGTGLLPRSSSAFAQGGDDSSGKLSRGDASILRFLAAAEILESDLSEQYWELSSAAGIAHRGDFASKINPYNPDLIKAITFTAGFHFGFIEQGGTSLYPALAQRVRDPEVLRVVLSIGPSGALHFQVWHDKAGNANAGNPPMTVVDPINNNSTVTFVNLTVPTGNDAVDELLAANLIMPEPCPFLNRSFPVCSIVRPTETTAAAMGVVKAFTGDRLFIGQSGEFMQLLNDVATDAGQARRE